MYIYTSRDGGYKSKNVPTNCDIIAYIVYVILTVSLLVGVLVKVVVVVGVGCIWKRHVHKIRWKVMKISIYNMFINTADI